jgi:putative transposase
MSVQIMLEKELSLRKALYYSGLSSSTYFYKPVPRQESRIDPLIVEKVKGIALDRPSYGARRIAAAMSHELDAPVNRKRVGRVFRVLNWTLPRRKKSEIIRSSAKLVRATRPYELWETDITFVWCGVDGWCYLFNVLDVFQREWLGYAFDTSAVKENAIMSVNNVLAAHPQVDTKELTLRCDNGSQYRSRAFRESMKALGIRLEFIYYSTPQQNGHIESFHKTLKKEYLWCQDFKNYQAAEIAIADAFKDYNQNRIHSALGYKTPYGFLQNWMMMNIKEEEKKL